MPASEFRCKYIIYYQCTLCNNYVHVGMKLEGN